MEKLSWRKLNEVLSTLPEEDVLQLLEDEKANACRGIILVRLHQRYCILRGARERSELGDLAVAK